MKKKVLALTLGLTMALSLGRLRWGHLHSRRLRL